MRTFQRILSVCFIVLMLSASTMANTTPGNPDKVANQQLRKEITAMIDSPTLKTDEEQIEVTFMVTKTKEVVVMSVQSDDIYLDSYVKGSLNYQKIETDGVEINTPYRVKVTYKQ